MKNACRILSILLHYPDAELWGHLPELRQTVGGLPQGEIKRALSGAMEEMQRSTLLELQQCYTAAFDMNPETTLNMAYHLHGNSEKRAAALVKLHQIYAQAGYECTSTELPDYLPLMLEFLGECADEKARAAVSDHLGALESLAGRLRGGAPVYAQLLQAAGALVGRAGPEPPQKR